MTEPLFSCHSEQMRGIFPQCLALREEIGDSEIERTKTTFVYFPTRENHGQHGCKVRLNRLISNVLVLAASARGGDHWYIDCS